MPLPADFMPFLRELQAHNERPWFEANRKRYEANRDAMLQLLVDLAPRVRALAPHVVVDPRPQGGSLMRIFRDVRFSKDKSPYKPAFAAQFWHEAGGEGAAPAFYLRLAPGSSAVGGGLWRPEASAVARIRQAIADKPAAWAHAVGEASRASACGMAGESLKKPPAGFDPHHPFIADIMRKDFALSSPLTDAEVQGADLESLILARLAQTAPFVRFLSEALGLPV